MYEIVRKIELEESIKSQFDLFANVVQDSNKHQFLKVWVCLTEPEELEYDMLFSIQWIESERQVDWLAEILAGNITWIVRTARQDLADQITNHKNAICKLIGEGNGH